MKILSPRAHGFVDYAVVALFLLAPTLFGFAGLAASLCYIMAAVHAAMTLLTDFPLGVARVIPFPVHGGIEAGVALFLFLAPWMFEFSHVPAARNFYVVSAITVGLVWFTTDYRAALASISSYATRYGAHRRSFS